MSCTLRLFQTVNFIHKLLVSLENESSVLPKRPAVYLYSKTNQTHNISNLFYCVTTLYMFRKVSPSIIRSLRLYIQHQVYVIQVLCLLASKQAQNLYGMMLYVQS
jgi:hypothetical protein